MNRDRTLHPYDGFIATRILQYTGLQENLEEIKKVAELATRTADKIEEQHTQEINNGVGSVVTRTKRRNLNWP